MSDNINWIKKLAEEFCLCVENSLVKSASKKSNNKKLDPKAKVRNKPNPVFPANNPRVKDNKDHYPLEDADQARDAWARAHQTGGKAPKWYKGTYNEFLSAVKRKIRSEFPSIEFSEDKKKSKKSK